MTYNRLPWYIIALLLIYTIYLQECSRPDCLDSVPSVSTDAFPDTARIVYQPCPDPPLISETSSSFKKQNSAKSKKQVKKVDAKEMDASQHFGPSVRGISQNHPSVSSSAISSSSISSSLSPHNLSIRTYSGSALTRHGQVNYSHEVAGKLLSSQYSITPFSSPPPIRKKIEAKSYSSLFVTGSLGVGQEVPNDIKPYAGLLYVPGKRKLALSLQYNWLHQSVLLGAGWRIAKWKR